MSLHFYRNVKIILQFIAIISLWKRILLMINIPIGAIT